MGSLRSVIRVGTFAALLLPAMSGLAQPTPTEVVERLHRAIGSGDGAGATATLASGVQIFESGYVERSRDEYLSHHFDADAKFAKTVKRTVIRQDAQVAGDMALVIAETESSGSYDGKPVKLLGTETAVLRRTDDQWLIVHLHWSSRKPKP